MTTTNSDPIGPVTNAGLEGVEIGLSCSRCGQPITVSYIAHGTDRDVLLGEAMQHLAAAAAREALRDDPAPRCVNCSTPPSDADPREAVWTKYPNDALSIDQTSPATRCSSRKCQAPVWRGVTRAKGKPTVFDIKPNGERTGTNHWRTCQDRERFRR